MKIRWKFSLVTKLTVSFMSVLVALWLMIEYQSYNNTFKHTLERSLVAFSELSGLRAEVSNTLFADASYDARQLNKQLKQFASMDKVNAQEIVSHYFPFQAKSHDDTLAMWVAQTFGNAGQHRYLDTFILKPNEGITIYAASDANDEYFKIRLREIKQLSVQTSTTGYRWGTPIKDTNSEDYHLSFSYSSDPQDPLSPQVGFSINLASAMSLNNALGPWGH
ncbi:hypothetical protein P4S55_01275 [Shewanella sp. PP-Sp27a-2]